MSAVTGQRTLSFTGERPAEPGKRSDEVVLAISPAFADFFSQTIVGLSHADVIRQILAVSV